MFERLLEYDRELFMYLNSRGHEKYDPFWLFVTNELHWAPVFVLLIIAIFIKVPKKEGFYNYWGRNTVGGFYITVNRGRKGTGHAVATFKWAIPDRYGPFFTGVYQLQLFLGTCIYLVCRNYIFNLGSPKIFLVDTVLVCLAISFASSRIFLGVHYPLDILVGGLVGIGIGFLFSKLFEKKPAPEI